MDTQKIDILAIDFQKDFIDGADNSAVAATIANFDQLPEAVQKAIAFKPALPVAGAWNDAVRFAALIDRVGRGINSIQVTMDTHSRYDLGHPMFWVNAKGENPAPFTQISSKDIKQGDWRPVVAAETDRMYKYALDMETKVDAEGNTRAIDVWTEHCIFGEEGYKVVEPVAEAFERWERKEIARVDYWFKGGNPNTEHYGGFKAEVLDPDDAATDFNAELFSLLQPSDWILIGGEALDYCVDSTVNQLADEFGEDSIKKMVLLEDATSAIVPEKGKAALERMKARGMKVCKTTDIGFKNGKIVMPF